MPPKRKRPTNAQVVRRGVKAYQSPGEARGVVKNLRAGGKERKDQLRALKADVWNELKPKRAKKVMRRARKIGRKKT